MSRERKRGNVILELLKNGALTTTEIIVNVAMTPLQVSYKGNIAPLRGRIFSVKDTLNRIEKDRQERRRFYNLLISLKRDGLIYLNTNNKEGRWIISKSGIDEIIKNKNQPKYRYIKNPSKEVVIISYDIPEKSRVHRGWLRSVLKLLDFKILHQSVWMGKTEIPHTFIHDLRDRKISSFIHIFTIGKQGSLKQVL